MSDSGKYVIKAENKVKKEENVHVVTFTSKESHMHVFGIFHADPKKHHVAHDTIRKAHEETMQIIADVGKTDTTSTETAAVEETQPEPEAAEPEPEGDTKEPAAKGKGGKEKKGKGGKVRPIETMVPLKNKLVLSTQLTNRTVGAGQKVKLSCCVQGPEPTMKWQKNGLPMAFGPKIKNLSRDGLGVLEFVNPVIDDSAEYTCICKNPWSELSTSCQLTVYNTNISADVPPTFTRPVKG